MSVLWSVLQAIGLLLAAPLISGLIRLVKARLQNRRGPGILQIYYDLFKLLAKDSVVSPTVSWVFRIAPYVFFVTAFAAAVLVPIVNYSDVPANDVFIFLYLLAAGRFWLVLASLDAGSAFGGMGGSREMYLSVLVEPALLLALLTVALRSGSTDLLSMASTATADSFSLPYIFAALAFFIVMITETGRIPVDNPDTHLELTMIHEAMVLEYSGRPLALILWAVALKQLILILLFVNIFLPWMLPNTLFPGGELLWLVGKVVFSALVLAIIETSTNKMRLFKVPEFLAVSGLLSLLALVAQ